MFDEFIHPYGIIFLIVDAFYVHLLSWNWQVLNTNLHSRFGYGDEVQCDDIEERSYAVSAIEKWIEKYPSEGILAQNWLMKFQPLQTNDGEGNEVEKELAEGTLYLLT